MKVVIVDDEVDARATLKQYLLKLQPEWNISEADSVASGLSLIGTTNPDLVFLDVMMTDGTGFDLLKQLPLPDFNLVIVSGHQEFALQAFRFSALDYLVKPVDWEELQSTLSRIKKTPQPWSDMLEALAQNMKGATDPQKRKLVLKDINTVYVVGVGNIIRCEASDNYTTFYLTDQSPIIVSKSLKEYDDLLTPLGFMRVHQSHLINLGQLKQFNKRDDSLLMKDGSEVPVSSRKRDQLLAELSKLS